MNDLAREIARAQRHLNAVEAQFRLLHGDLPEIPHEEVIERAREMLIGSGVFDGNPDGLERALAALGRNRG